MEFYMEIYFHDEKQLSSMIFILSSNASRRGYFIFFPPTMVKRPLSELVDQTIY